MQNTDSGKSLTSCHCCGLIQYRGEIDANSRLVCHRCGTSVEHQHPHQNQVSAALALAALALYLPAMMLPMISMERLGQANESSLIQGVVSLWRDGHWFIGGLIFAFSILLPPAKLVILWLLTQQRWITRHHHKASLYRTVEHIGRWGMLDVLLVAVLVAFVKLGNLVEIEPGNGLAAFAAMVLLSLIASLCFNPAMMWAEVTSDNVE